MFPKDSAFSQGDNHVRRLFESTEKAIEREEHRHEVPVPLNQLEEWYRELDAMAVRHVEARLSNFHIAASALDDVADAAADLRDSVAAYLRG
jgi:hypothetical protein